MTTAEKLVERLGELGRTCGTAESCTGGGIGSAITAVPGSSAVFMGGVTAAGENPSHPALEQAALLGNSI